MIFFASPPSIALVAFLASGRVGGDPVGSLMGLVVVATFVLVMSISSLGEKHSSWTNLAALADKMKFELRPASQRFRIFAPLPSVAGCHRGRDVRIFFTGGGRASPDLSFVAVRLNSTELPDLEVRENTTPTFRRIAQSFGQRRISTGNVAFDRRFVVESPRPSFAYAMLVPEVCASLLAMPSSSHLWIGGGEVKFAEEGSFEDIQRTDRIAAQLDFICDLADSAEIYGTKSS